LQSISDIQKPIISKAEGTPKADERTPKKKDRQKELENSGPEYVPK
jgi:hypothetical protein